ncbi:MAG: nuclear transport factor 2 family protein, partial [Candidatus Binataceae bacterium]
MDTTELEKRVEAVEAIKQLKARYCAACDNRYDADAIAELFTEDGIWDGEGFGRFEGRDAIRAFFRTCPNTRSFAIHQVMNPMIEVKGGRARGSWYLLAPCTLRRNNRAMWLAARYEEEYVNSGGTWKIKHLKGIGRFFAAYDTGWAKKQTST